ncbi:MAG: hypothetical protein A2Z29_00150 [Chloroflexi bacterium RBG_16_56_11]|nr:MAG: hypothetical protein A2Z29_00150 [Chloroflexi bacterium RBG_16_56_11]
MPQLPELQLEQEPPDVPAMVLGTPPVEAVKQAKVDIFRRDILWHFGQSAGCCAWLKGRSRSKVTSHFGQTYS